MPCFMLRAPLARAPPTPRAQVQELGGANCVVLRQEGAQGAISTVVLRGATEGLLDDVERAVDDGVNTYKVRWGTTRAQYQTLLCTCPITRRGACCRVNACPITCVMRLRPCACCEPGPCTLNPLHSVSCTR